MEFSKSVIPCLRQFLCQTGNHEVTQELRLGEEMPDAGKVLGCWGQLLARGKQWRDRSVSFTGGCTVWVLYEPEDHSQPYMVEGYVPVQLQWDLPEQKENGDICVALRFAGLDARIVTPRKLMLRANIGSQVRVYVPDQVESYSWKNVPEDVQLLEKTYPVTLLRYAGEKIASPEEQFSLPSARKILCCCMNPKVTESRLSGGRLLIKGVGKLQLLCQGQDEKLFTADFDLPFSQLADVDPEFIEQGMADVVVCTTALEPELMEDGQLRVRADLVCQYGVYQRKELSYVEDAYSTLHDLSPVKEQLRLPVLLDQSRELVSAEINWEEDNADVVNSRLLTGFPQLRHQEDGMVMEMTGICQVLYYDRDGNLHSSNLPWTNTIPLAASDNCRICTSVTDGDAPCVKHGSVTANLELQELCMVGDEKTVVTGFQIGDEKRPDPTRPTLILRRAGNRDLWELAKAYGSTVDAIVNVNGLTDGPMEDAFLLIPVM